MTRTLLLLLATLLACSDGDKEEDDDGQDADDDGWLVEVDCDDDNPDVHPEHPETCDDLDNDCDGAIDEDLGGSYWVDADGDGYGDPEQGVSGCAQPENTVINDGDCDDSAITVNPGAAEVCDGVDNDCDDQTDEDVLLTLYVDADGDGYGGLDAVTGEACAVGDGLSETADDCDDTNAEIHPDADESDCTDLTDKNCDGVVQWVDADGDGWPTCLDCDDEDVEFSPDAVEVCDDVDNDCDDVIDDDAAEEDMNLWYIDQDGDGYGDASTPAYACDAPAGYVDNFNDCDDLNRGINPGTPEICDGLDDNCDGVTDPGC